MAGFLRKKPKQEPPPKATPVHPGNVPSGTPTPLFARFASSSSSQSQQEPPRIVSSPMLLSSAPRKSGPVAQNRGERAVAGNSAHGVRGDVSLRDVEMRNQRIQPYMTERFQERPKNTTTIEARPQQQQHQPLAAQPARARPASRVPMLDKPLLPSLPTHEPDMFNPHTYALNSAGPYNTPPQAPPHTQEFAGERPWATPSQHNKPLPHPTPTAPNSRPVPRKPNQTPDPAMLKHNRTYSVTPPNNPLPNSPPRRLMSTQAVSYTQPPSSRAPKFQPSSPPAYTPEAHFDPDHASHSQTLTPQPSRQDLQPAENGARPDSGDPPGRTTPAPDAAMAQQYSALLEVAFGEQSTSGNQRHSFRSPALADSPLPDPASFSFQQELDSPFLPSPSSSPTAHRKLSKLNSNGQPQTASRTRLSVAYAENPAPAAPHPLPAKPDNRQSYQPPYADNMGVDISSFDVSALPSPYKNAPLNGSFPQPRAPLPSPQQQRVPKQTAHPPPRTSVSMRSANPPPVPGKPLIFAAMAALDQEDSSTPDRQSITIEPVPTFPPSSPPPPHHAYPSPPAEFFFPPGPAPPPHPYPHHFPAPNAGLTRPELYALPTPPTQHATAPHQRPQHSHFPQPSSSPPQSEVHTPYIAGPRALPPTEQPRTGSGTGTGARRSPTRMRKLSKARNPAQESSDFSVHSHASSISGAHHRSPGKARPVTPVSQGQGQGQGVGRVAPPVIEDDGVGVPLDDDPFAKVEGVRLLKPATSSRAGSPEKEKEKEGTIRRHRSKGQLSKDGASEDFHSASEGGEESLHASHAGHMHTHTHTHTEALLPSVSPSQAAPPIDTADGEDRLTAYLAEPPLLAALLGFLSFYDWCMVLGLSRGIRFALVQDARLREAVLERFLRTVGYARWGWDEPDPVSLSLQDLNDYMRGVSTPTHEYARVAGLYVHSLTVHPSHRDASLYDTVHQLAAATRAYTRVVLRLRAQAEKEASVARARNGRAGSRPPSRAPSPTMSSTFSHSNHSYSSPPPVTRAAAVAVAAAPASTGIAFSSPLFRLRRAPLLRVFVPSPDGDWLSDKSVLECEAECRRAGVAHLMRAGDVVWDVAVGDEGNVGRLVWDGSYLLDLDYTYTAIGDLPKYMPTLAFPPSYFHRVIRTGASSSSNPIVHMDLSPWGEEIAMNLQLLQDRVRTETPQGAYHNVVRWVHRSSFVVRPPPRGAVRMYSSPQGRNGGGAVVAAAAGRLPIPDSNGLYVDGGWYGTIVVETEGTNEALADLQDRCGPGAFPPRARGVNGQGTLMDRESKKVFRIMREKSRPGEIWIRAVSAKERLL